MRSTNDSIEVFFRDKAFFMTIDKPEERQCVEKSKTSKCLPEGLDGLVEEREFC